MSLKRKVKMFAETANEVDLGTGVAWWLRAAGLSAKEVGRVLGQSEGTGKRLRSGIAPTSKQLSRLSAHFGRPFVSFVTETLVGPSDAVLAAELDDINRCLERLEREDHGVDRATDAADAPTHRGVASPPSHVVAGMAHSARGVRR